MRLVDADALKAYIDAQKGRPFIGCTIGEALKIMTDEQPTIEPEQRWIPWDGRRFPDDSGMYIVTAYDGIKEQVTFVKYQKRLKWWVLTGARAYWRVIAWMPLPEPWKGEQP